MNLFYSILLEVVVKWLHVYFESVLFFSVGSGCNVVVCVLCSILLNVRNGCKMSILLSPLFYPVVLEMVAKWLCIYFESTLFCRSGCKNVVCLLGVRNLEYCMVSLSLLCAGLRRFLFVRKWST